MTNNNAAKHQTSDRQNNKEMNIQENSSGTDSDLDNETISASSWRPTDDDDHLKVSSKVSTGAAGQSPAENIETENPGKNPG